MYQISKPTAETIERKTPITGTNNPTASPFATIPTDAITYPKLLLRSITTEMIKGATASRT